MSRRVTRCFMRHTMLHPPQAQAGSGGGSDPTSGRDRGSGASGSGSAAPKVDHQAAWVALAPEQRAVYEDMEARWAWVPLRLCFC